MTIFIYLDQTDTKYFVYFKLSKLKRAFQVNPPSAPAGVSTHNPGVHRAHFYEVLSQSMAGYCPHVQPVKGEEEGEGAGPGHSARTPQSEVATYANEEAANFQYQNQLVNIVME